MNRLRVLLAVVALALLGCARPVDTAILSANAARIGIATSHDALAAYERARLAEVARSVAGDTADPKIKDTKIAAVKAEAAKYERAWGVYDAACVAWRVAAAAIQVAQDVEKNGGKPDIAMILADLSKVAQLQRDIVLALRELGAMPQPAGAPAAAPKEVSP